MQKHEGGRNDDSNWQFLSVQQMRTDTQLYITLYYTIMYIQLYLSYMQYLGAQHSIIISICKYA